jgi:hypothetical protein
MSRAPTTAAQWAKRLHLLDATEIAALYDRPQFTDEEQAYYFALTPTEITHMQTFTDSAVQAVFVLQLGYFKAKQRFFSLELAEVRADLIFILGHAGLTVTPDNLRILNPRTIQQQRQLILSHVRYRHAHAAERAHAYQVVLQAARISPKPQYLLRILLQHCAAERIILPGYTTVQETIIGKAAAGGGRADPAGRHAHPAGADGPGGGGPDDCDGERYRAAHSQGGVQQRYHGGGLAGAGHRGGLYALEGPADRGANARIDTALGHG